MTPDKEIEVAKRKFAQAMVPFYGVFGVMDTYYEYKPMKHSLEITTFFRHNGVKYRHDYEIFLLEHLPKVQEIRDNLWWSMREYQKTKAPTATVPAARLLATQYGNLVYTGP